MTREEAKEAVKEAYGNSEYADEIIKALEQEPIIDKIRTEIDNIEINGYVRDVECFSMGIRCALNIIDKYKAESEVENGNDD